MDVLFYVTVILLSIIILAGIGYLIHYFINEKARADKGDDNE